jgi:enoyl-CoA hydratase/carnithine racemase
MRGVLNVSSIVDVSVCDGVARVLLNNPAKRNALSTAMVSSLTQQLATLRADKSVRFVVIEGAGHVFSSGHDLKELQSMDARDADALFKASAKMMSDIQTLQVPVLARLDGLAAAAGLQLLSSCDMAVCTKSATFSTPGVRFGLFCTTPSVAAWRSSYSAKALSHMLFTGDAVGAAEALRMGLVSHVFEDAAQMSAFVEATGERIKSLPRDVIALGKQAFIRQTQMRNASEAMGFAIDVMVDNLGLDSCKTGLDAFVSKKTPKFV